MSEPDMDLASGIAAFEAKEFRRALQLLTPLAEDGDADAQFRLAIMCQNGLGRVASETQALHWMQASAGQDHGLALHGLGVPRPAGPRRLALASRRAISSREPNNRTERPTVTMSPNLRIRN